MWLVSPSTSGAPQGGMGQSFMPSTDTEKHLGRHMGCGYRRVSGHGRLSKSSAPTSGDGAAQRRALRDMTTQLWAWGVQPALGIRRLVRDDI